MNYRFVGRNPPAGIERFKLSYGEVVKRIRCFPRRKILVRRGSGELILTMTYLLRKLTTGTLEDFM